jgi:hypothetical protein
MPRKIEPFTASEEHPFPAPRRTQAQPAIVINLLRIRLEDKDIG